MKRLKIIFSINTNKSELLSDNPYSIIKEEKIG